MNHQAEHCDPHEEVHVPNKHIRQPTSSTLPVNPYCPHTCTGAHREILKYLNTLILALKEKKKI